MASVIQMTVNGKNEEYLIPDSMTLLDFLRDRLQLTGTKQGCDGGECGACSVLVNGKQRLSCITLAKTVSGKSVETIESAYSNGRLSNLQAAFHEKLGTQCGFCTPGMIMAAESLLRDKANPDRKDIEAALSGNLCRCTGYVKIIESVQTAIDANEAGK